LKIDLINIVINKILTHKKKIILTILLLSGIIFSINYIITKKKIHHLFSHKQIQIAKKYIFPYKYISDLELKISKLPNLERELYFKKNKKNITVAKKKDILLSNNQILKSYILIEGFYTGIQNIYPGSGYIDYYQGNLFVISARGTLAYAANIENDLNFKQIKNNIDDFINFKHFKKDKSFSIKDIFIQDDKILVSYTEEILEDCWNTSIIYGDINYKKIQFKKLFSTDQCIHSLKNVDRVFSAHQSGGKIINFDEKHILLSVGEYRNRFLAQDKESINGKIIKININNSSYEIISMGHRNPQGLYYDKLNNFILETEHGPKGGDEINLIEVDRINEHELLNYGWAIASKGEHYSGKKDVKTYQKYPLYKSHYEYGFIEPLKSFIPSVAISEITKITNSRYVVGTMGDKSLYFFELDNEKKIINLERVKVFERVRDLIFKDNNLYLFLEDTASIGIINFD
jgi:hypothetical protein